MIYHEWNFTDITLTPAQQWHSRKQCKQITGSGDTVQSSPLPTRAIKLISYWGATCSLNAL